MFEDLEPRKARGAALETVTREDLDAYAVDELRERIEMLQGEITRVQRAIDGKSSQRNAADALFSFRS